MEIKDKVSNNLRGEALTNALNFVDYLIAKHPARRNIK
jgi:hypothetical protein